MEKEIEAWLSKRGIKVLLGGEGVGLHYKHIWPVTEINLAPYGEDVPWVTVSSEKYLGKTGTRMGVIIYEYEKQAGAADWS